MVDMKHNSTKHKLKAIQQVLPESSDNVVEIAIVRRRSECRFCQNNKQVDQNGDNSNKDSQNESHRGQSNMVESVSIIRFAPHCCCVGAEMRTRWQCQPEPNAHDSIVTHSNVCHWFDLSSCCVVIFRLSSDGLWNENFSTWAKTPSSRHAAPTPSAVSSKAMRMSPVRMHTYLHERGNN